MEEVWEICFNASKVGMNGAKYAMRLSAAGSQNNWHPKEKMKWNKSFTIAVSTSQKDILEIK